MRRKTSTLRILIYCMLFIFAIIQVFPLIWTFMISFKTNEQIMLDGTFSLPDRWMVENYMIAWTKGKVQDYFLNSVLVASISVAFTLLFSSMIGYAIARMRWRLSGLTLYLFMAGLMVPIHAILIPVFIILKDLGLLSSLLSLILPYITIGMPLGVFIFTNFLRSLPFELEAAAFIDGCSVIGAFFRIILPVIQPSFVTVGIFCFLHNWNEFIMASTFLQNPRLKTLPLGLMAFQGDFSVQWGQMAAAILIASIPVIIAYIIFSERVEASFAAGALLK